MSSTKDNYYMFGCLTKSGFMCFGDVFFSIDEADEKAEEFIDDNHLLSYYEIAEEWQHSPIKIINFKDLTEKDVFFKGYVNGWKQSFKKDLALVTALRYPDVNFQKAEEFIDSLNNDDLRNLINDFNTENGNILVRK